MIKNLDTRGRVLRLSMALILLFLSVKFKSKILLVGSAFTLFEALFSWCVVYQILGINHCKIKK